MENQSHERAAGAATVKHDWHPRPAILLPGQRLLPAHRSTVDRGGRAGGGGWSQWQWSARFCFWYLIVHGQNENDSYNRLELRLQIVTH